MRINTNTRSWAAMALFILALALSGCATGGEEAQSDGGAAVKDRAAGVSPPESGVGYGAPDKAVSGDVTGEAVSSSVVPQDDFGRKIVKTVYLGITPEDVQGGAARTQQVAAQFGRTIVSGQTYRADNALYADLIISVPSDRFEEALDELRGLARRLRPIQSRARTSPRGTSTCSRGSGTCSRRSSRSSICTTGLTTCRTRSPSSAS
jgi:Domain of unknown function (DUF4349)